MTYEEYRALVLKTKDDAGFVDPPALNRWTQAQSWLQHMVIDGTLDRERGRLGGRYKIVLNPRPESERLDFWKRYKAHYAPFAKPDLS